MVRCVFFLGVRDRSLVKFLMGLERARISDGVLWDTAMGMDLENMLDIFSYF